MKRIITADFFAGNRTAAMQALEGGVLVVTAYKSMQRSNDAAHKFEQEGNFWYLTGIERPGWWVIIDASRSKSWLVQPDVDPVHTLFDGSLSPERAMDISGVQEVISQREAEELLVQTARQHRLAYTVNQPDHDHFDFVLNPAQRELRDKLERIFADVQDFRSKLAGLRAIKQSVEIKAIQAAIDIAADALKLVRANMATYSYEYQIEAELSGEFRRRGATGHAYDPIVAGAANACTLHYIENNDKLKKRSLVLLDVGAQVEHYAADITRTLSVGAPTKRQIAVHAAVCAARTDIVAMLRPGLSVQEYSQKVDARMKHALIDLGLIDSPEDEKYRAYFPHAISHGLGLDVHDSLGGLAQFETGMVLTVEPGIYIPEEGIGVRVEDDILITGSGHRNLSRRIPSTL